ncbi:MAG TPA: TlpA disulfide reductase family protein [Acidimicrobiales bacterium]
MSLSETTKPARGHPSPMMFVSLGLGAVIAIALITVVSVLTGGKVTNANTTPKAALDGTRIASFTTGGLDGGSQKAPWSSGRPSVLVFFASWCGPCQGEMPKLAKYVSTHHEGNVEVLGIDAGDERGAALSFTKKDHVTFPIAFDPNDSITAGLFKFAALPETVFLNARGVVESVHVGAIRVAEFASGIKSLES